MELGFYDQEILGPDFICCTTETIPNCTYLYFVFCDLFHIVHSLWCLDPFKCVHMPVCIYQVLSGMSCLYTNTVWDTLYILQPFTQLAVLVHWIFGQLLWLLFESNLSHLWCSLEASATHIIEGNFLYWKYKNWFVEIFIKGVSDCQLL